MFEEIEKEIRSNELCTMRLIHKQDVVYECIYFMKISCNNTPFWQLVVIDDKVQFTVDKSLVGDMNVIQSVNKYNIFSFLSLTEFPSSTWQEVFYAG